MASLINPNHFCLSQAGADLIKEFEGLRLEAYLDSNGICTIGYGHTGPDVKLGMVITKPKADLLFQWDALKASQAVNGYTTFPLKDQNEFDALVDFVFNIGVEAFKTSTLLKDLNSGQLSDVPYQLERWCHANDHQVILGLLRRREAEAKLFES